jgi:pre-mRNA-splicing factor ATP-dependent RNA helicase DHX38/PRP16
MSWSSRSDRTSKNTGSRSGIGLDSDEWSTPSRLGSVNGTNNTTLADDDDDDDARSVVSTISTGTTTTVLTNRALQRSGFLVADEAADRDRREMYDAAEEDEDFDRDFYLSEEGQAAMHEANDQVFLGNPLKFKAREEQMSRTRAKGDAKTAGMSARRSQLLQDQEAWEDNRLLQSGVAINKDVKTDFDDEEDARVSLIVHHLKPPFLDGRVSFSMQQTTVATVRDPSADMATNARKGSELLKHVRERKDKMKMRARFWELGGSRIGDAMGIARPDDQKEKGPEALQVGSEEEAVDYKEGSSFAKHVKDQKNEAQSNFAKTLSIQQQREYLPVYSVKEELINVIRENQITVIVGETGSGICYANTKMP